MSASEPAPETRICRTCNHVRPYPSGFFRNNKYPDDRDTRCSQCSRAAVRASRDGQTRRRNRRRKSESQQYHEAVAREEQRAAEATAKALERVIPIDQFHVRRPA